MNRDDVLAVCAGFTEATEDYPFGDDVTVFKVGGKMFALVLLTGNPGMVTLKCDPDWGTPAAGAVPRRAGQPRQAEPLCRSPLT